MHSITLLEGSWVPAIIPILNAFFLPDGRAEMKFTVLNSL